MLRIEARPVVGGGPAAGELRRVHRVHDGVAGPGVHGQSVLGALRSDIFPEEMEPMNAALLDVGRLETTSRSAKQDCAGWGFLAVSSN